MTTASTRSGKIAILIPTYNGGDLLRETVSSIAASALPGDCYEILISDNASNDRSCEFLPEQDAQGAPIRVRRNAQDLGRVENWNRAIAYAEELGFGYAIFLMVGDLLSGTGLSTLRDRMEQQQAVLGIACYQIVDEQLRPLRIARKIHWIGNSGEGIPANRFLVQTFAAGAMLYGPLGANLYRIDQPGRLRFDPADGSHTDQLATAMFLQAADGRVVYLDQPISLWRQRPGRFHSSMTPTSRLEGDVRVMEYACRAGRLQPDYAKIRASLLLRAVVLTRGNLVMSWRCAKTLAGIGGVSWIWLATLLWRQVWYRTPWLVRT